MAQKFFNGRRVLDVRPDRRAPGKVRIKVVTATNFDGTTQKSEWISVDETVYRENTTVRVQGKQFPYRRTVV